MSVTNGFRRLDMMQIALLISKIALLTPKIELSLVLFFIFLNPEETVSSTITPVIKKFFVLSPVPPLISIKSLLRFYDSRLKSLNCKS